MIRMKPTSDGRYSLSPLHLAASYGHIRVLKTILKVKSKFEFIENKVVFFFLHLKNFYFD